jgi:hypothetical protein
MLRIFLGLILALALNYACHSQETVITRDHSCGDECTWGVPACESAWRPNISAVFLGRATEIRKEDVPILLDGEKALTERLSVTFDVEESFLGVAEKRVIVISGGDLCGFPFSKGHEYLVYGRRLQGGEIQVRACSSTKWKNEAAEDLNYLRNLSIASRGGTIYGTAFRYTDSTSMKVRRGVPATGKKVEIHGPTKNYEAVVDAKGTFTISALPPGQYAVLLNSDETVYSSRLHQSTTVELVDKGCGKFEFWIDPFTRKDSEAPRDILTLSLQKVLRRTSTPIRAW